MDNNKIILGGGNQHCMKRNSFYPHMLFFLGTESLRSASAPKMPTTKLKRLSIYW